MCVAFPARAGQRVVVLYLVRTRQVLLIVVYCSIPGSICVEEKVPAVQYKALRVAGGSARYARSPGRMERNDRCSRWSDNFRSNRRLANVK